MGTRYRVTLTEEERNGLEALTRNGKTPIKKFIHLLADKAVELELAPAVSHMTVQRVLKNWRSAFAHCVHAGPA